MNTRINEIVVLAFRPRGRRRKTEIPTIQLRSFNKGGQLIDGVNRLDCSISVRHGLLNRRLLRVPLYVGIRIMEERSAARADPRPMD